MRTNCACTSEGISTDNFPNERRTVRPLGIYPQRWPLALPHYDVGLERLLRAGIETPGDTFLAGNYLRGIGLPMLLEKAWDVAQQVQQPG